MGQPVGLERQLPACVGAAQVATQAGVGRSVAGPRHWKDLRALRVPCWHPPPDVGESLRVSRGRKLGLSAGVLILLACLVTLLVSLGGPTSGWGENARAWGDDEFWMDVLIQGVGWLLLT